MTAVAALGDDSSWTFAAGVKSAASRREGREPREETLQLPQLLPTCFFYGHLQVFGIISAVAVVTTVDSGAVSRPLAFTAKVQMLCPFRSASCWEAVGRLTGGSGDRHAFQY